MSFTQLWSPNSTTNDKVDDDGKSIADEPDLTEEKEIDCSESKATILRPDSFRVAFPISSTADEHFDSGSGTKHSYSAKPASDDAHLSLQLQHPPRKTRWCWASKLHRHIKITESRSINNGCLETLHMHHEKIDDLEASLIGYEAKETSDETEETMT
ncbi:hypothetical protein ZIOFF_013785 [Zingiber officinale]|uniref:Uncharacterized protein n=1 Tax=Zingiber officinale TaxID=94328 RepID=A0A8J5HC51_ZINOF|nr:hypothetical protein ZIOFF_013785 [Zingiber officinale]